jgi:voltage-gated potassium channel
MRPTVVTLRQAARAVPWFALLIAVGTVGFMLVSDESAFDAFYRTMIIVYTAGLVVPPESVGEKLLTLLVVVWGVAIFLYVFGIVIELTVSGTVSGAWLARRTRRKIDRMRDHYIICGYGRVGRRVAREFREADVSYVVLDFQRDAIAFAVESGDVFVEGNGTEDKDLQAAGLEHARGLVASADSDVDNLYITLSARAARPELLIVARASDDDAAAKLRLAGADRVIQPYSTAGREMAKLVLKPQVAAFLEVVSQTGNAEMSFEEIVVTPACNQAGKSIRDLRVREVTGAMIIALRKRDGTFDTTPAPEATLDAGDVLIAVGTSDELRRLEELFAPAKAGAV